MAIQNGPLPVPPSLPPVPPPAPKYLTVDQADINWALDLEMKVKDGHQPTPEETERYQDIARKLATETQAVAETETNPAAAFAGAEASTEASTESSKGLLDYPKDALMSVSEYAAAGTAKNTVEFYEDMHDIKQAGSDFVDNIKHGHGLKAGGNVLKMGWNVLSSIGNAVQTGVCSTVGGITMIPTAALNLLDKGGEVAGKKLHASDSAVVRGLGSGVKFFVGENSNKSYLDSVQAAAREAKTKAQSPE
ncbi:MAG: hypothetical protein ACAI44_13595 [Candidatus Sericytochromatia bacterium]